MALHTRLGKKMMIRIPNIKEQHGKNIRKENAE